MKNIDYGTVEFEGKTLTLTQSPYCDLYYGTYKYMASCIDGEGGLYKTYWDITEQDAENEEECCDWDEYTVRFCGEE